MKLTVKDFDIGMEVKNNGIEFGVYDTAGSHLGDFVVTKTNVIWCKGRIRRPNGKKLSWTKFIKYMDSQP